MIVQIDSREQLPYDFKRYECETVVAGLPTGDYGLVGYGLVAVERKSIDDLVGALTVGRQRFELELERSRALDYFAVVIEASMDDIRLHKYTSRASPHSMLQSVLSLGVEFRAPFIFAGSRTGGEYTTFHVLRHWLRKNIPPKIK